MRTVSRIDAGGYFAGDVLLTDGQDAPQDTVATRPQEGFYRPRWTGTTWTEGMAVSGLLVAAKAAKRAELAGAFVGANTALYPEVEDVFSIWLAVPEYAADPNATRPTAIRANITRLRDRLAAVEAATTVAGVEAVAWA